MFCYGHVHGGGYGQGHGRGQTQGHGLGLGPGHGRGNGPGHGRGHGRSLVLVLFHLEHEYIKIFYDSFCNPFFLCAGGG